MEIKTKRQEEGDRLSQALGISEGRYEVLRGHLLDEIMTDQLPSEQIRMILGIPDLTETEQAYLVYQAGTCDGYFRAVHDLRGLFSQVTMVKQRSPEASDPGDAARRKLRLAAEQAEELADD